MKNLFYKLLFLALISLSSINTVKAAMEPFIGEIQAYGFNFCPNGWLAADGRLLSIAQNTALFSLLGTTYGGNGTTTFALPDLRGRTLIGAGNGNGLTNRVLGEMAGTENETLTISQIPSHSHSYSFIVKEGRGVSTTASNSFLGQSGIFRNTGINVPMASQTTTLSGSSQPHNNMPPYLAITYCIASEGVYPSRN